MRRLLFALLLLTATLSWGQGVCVGGSTVLNKGGFNQLATVISNASIYVGQYGATGIPLTPAATVYTDKTLSTIAAQPLSTDVNGNFTICAPPGSYTVAITAPNVLNFTYNEFEPLLPDVNTTITGNWTFTGTTTFSTIVLNNLTLSGSINETGIHIAYNNIPLVQNGIPSEVGYNKRVATSGNIGATTLYTVPSSGTDNLYSVACYEIVTIVAGVSSTLPTCQVLWTDADNNTAQTGAPVQSQSGNLLTTFGQGRIFINAKNGTTIQYQTTGYASNPALAMQYSAIVIVEAY